MGHLILKKSVAKKLFKVEEWMLFGLDSNWLQQDLSCFFQWVKKHVGSVIYYRSYNVLK